MLPRPYDLEQPEFLQNIDRLAAHGGCGRGCYVESNVTVLGDVWSYGDGRTNTHVVEEVGRVSHSHGREQVVASSPSSGISFSSWMPGCYPNLGEIVLQGADFYGDEGEPLTMSKRCRLVTLLSSPGSCITTWRRQMWRLDFISSVEPCLAIESDDIIRLTQIVRSKY